MNRRAFLKAGGLALFSISLGGTPMFLERTAHAAIGDSGYRRRKTLVTIFQRGAMDGLMAVNPFEDEALRKLRSQLAMSAAKSAGEGRLLDLDGHFGLHPALSPLFPFFQEGQLGIVHGIGSPNTTRSHFDAQDYMESGTPDRKGTATGWLNRAIGLLGHEATPFQAVSLTPAMPRALYGDAPAIAVTNLEDFRVKLPGAGKVAKSAGNSFEALYRETTQDLLRGSGNEGFDAIKTLGELEIRNYKPSKGASYPNSPLARSLRQIAMLIKADVGLEVAFAESGGWDTHVRQGTVQGSFAQRANDLARSISAFWTDLEAYQDNVTLMTMTEFGRTVHQNGSGGTDHGRASCMFVLGNNVKGGKVHGDISDRLEVSALEDGRDLPVTTDFRALFAEVAGYQLNINRDDILFPGWKGERLPMIR